MIAPKDLNVNKAKNNIADFNMSNFSDGVVIGSAIVNMIEHIQTKKTENDFAKISKFVGEIKSSLQ